MTTGMTWAKIRCNDGMTWPDVKVILITTFLADSKQLDRTQFHYCTNYCTNKTLGYGLQAITHRHVLVI